MAVKQRWEHINGRLKEAGIDPSKMLYELPKGQRTRARKIVAGVDREIAETRAYKVGSKTGGRRMNAALDGSGLPAYKAPKKKAATKAKTKSGKSGKSGKSSLSPNGFKKGSGPQGLLPGQSRNAKNGRFT